MGRLRTFCLVGTIAVFISGSAISASPEFCEELDGGKPRYQTYPLEGKIQAIRSVLVDHVFEGKRANGDRIVDVILKCSSDPQYHQKTLDLLFHGFCNWSQGEYETRDQYFNRNLGRIFWDLTSYYGAKLADDANEAVALTAKPKTKATGYLRLAEVFEEAYPSSEFTLNFYQQALEAANEPASVNEKASGEAQRGIDRVVESQFLELVSATHDIGRDFWIIRRQKLGKLGTLIRKGHAADVLLQEGRTTNRGVPLPLFSGFNLLTEVKDGQLYGLQLLESDGYKRDFGPAQKFKRIRYIFAQEYGHFITTAHNSPEQPAGLSLERTDAYLPKEYSPFDKLVLFDEFLTRHEEYNERARPHIDDLVFDYAKQRNTLEAYESYLADFPEGRHAEEVGYQVESLYFDDAREANTITAYEAFIARYTQGHFTESAAFEIARISSTVESYNTFLDSYPSGEFAEQASFERADVAGTVASYQQYLDSYPDGKYAKRATELLAFGRARSKDTIAGYKLFLAAFQKGIKSGDALARLYRLESLASSTLENLQGFYKHYRPGGNASNKEAEEVLQLLEQFAHREKLSSAFLLLYQQTGNADDFEQAYVATVSAEEELVLVQHEPEKFFILPDPENTPRGLGNAKARKSFWLQNPIVTAEPIFHLPVYSATRFGRYRARVEMQVELAYRQRFRGLTYIFTGGVFDRDWTEISTAESAFAIGENPDISTVELRFPQLEYLRKTGSDVWGGVRKELKENEMKIKNVTFLSVELD